MAAIFLRLGCLGFGGPIAIMGMLEEEVCRKRRWIAPEKFHEMYAVCKLLPGPVVTQMSIYLGRKQAGVWGGILAGALFILPSFLLVLGLSALYIHFGQGVGDSRGFHGMQAGALAVILISVYQLARPYFRRSATLPRTLLIAGASAVLCWFYPRLEPLIILGFGLIGVVGAGAFPARPRDFSLPLALSIFWVFFKAGAFVFGTGLAIVPMLEADVVEHYGWITHSQFMDGLAIGQITPGPVVITSTFIGYLTAGLWAACLATFAIFLPSFFNVLVLVPLTWEKWSHSPRAKRFPEWAVPSVIGCIGAVTLKLAAFTLNTWEKGALFAAALAIFQMMKPPLWLLIPVAGALGLVLELGRGGFGF